MNKFSIFALVAMLFVACTTDQTADVQPIDAPETLTVSFEENTRIQLQNGKTVWTKGDLVSVFYKSYDNLKFKFDGETGDRTGTLSMVNGGLGPQTIDHTIVIYPYSTDYRISLDSGGIDALLPATQYYAKDSYGIGNNLMVAQSEFTNFSLRNTCGWLKLQLTGNGEKVKSITLKGNNDEQVAGLVHIATSNAALTLATTVGDVPAEDENGVGGTGGGLVFDNTILTEVTLNCGEGVTLGEEATAFYIALPPQTFEKGFTAEIQSAGYEPMILNTDNSVVIERNAIQPMASVEYNGQRIIPNNEIWYTSSDGKIVTPYKTDAFGVSIKSNVYEDGKGVITFDGNVTSIGYSAFCDCSSLTSITIPDSVTEIGRDAFCDCSSLTSVTIGNSVTSIGNYAFYLCYGLTSITIPNSVTSIGYSAFFLCRSLTSVTIPDSVTLIADYAFCNCSSLTSVTIPNSVTSIGENAFSYCSGLTSITIPDSITSIGCKAFSYCSGLTSVTIPDSVTSIGVYAFFNCSSLTSVTIPDSVTSIGQYAFLNCIGLTSVYCKPTTPPTGGYDIFYNNASGRKIYVPASDDDSIINAYKSAEYWSGYANDIEEYDFSAEQ